MAIKRQYPHLSQIKDQPTQSSLRIIFDRIFENADKLATAFADIETAQAKITEQGTNLDKLTKKFNQSSISAGKMTTVTGSTTTEGDGGVTNPDGGLGMLGCSEKGTDGHPTAGLPLTPETAGKIICGTGMEFPALLAPTVDQATRDANMFEMLNRMIWHLNQYGFVGVNRSNPVGEISKWMLGFSAAGTFYGYRVFGYENYTETMTTTMVQFGAEDLHPVTNGGLAD